MNKWSNKPNEERIRGSPLFRSDLGGGVVIHVSYLCLF